MDKHQFLKDYIDAEFDALLRSAQLYVYRSKLNHVENAERLARDILNEVVADALKNADAYDENRRLRPWLMGMLTIAIKRRVSAEYKRHQREPLIRDIYDNPLLSDDELFEMVAEVMDDNPPSQGITSQESVETLLAPVSTDDRKILRLAILDELDRGTLAEEYGISEGAVRVRLSRALKRLRQAHLNEKKVSDGN